MTNKGVSLGEIINVQTMLTKKEISQADYDQLKLDLSPEELLYLLLSLFVSQTYQSASKIYTKVRLKSTDITF